jgi:hypothetical protein
VGNQFHGLSHTTLLCSVRYVATVICFHVTIIIIQPQYI